MCHAGPRLLSVQVCLYKFDRNSPKLLGVKGDSSALDIAREGDPIPPELEIDALRAHPRFAEAMRACARNTIDYHGRGRMIGWLLSDRTLFVLGLAAVGMDADGRPDDSRSGLTPGRFKAFCVHNGVCSEGRAAAILAFMRLSGHLEAESHPADRRITRLRPTAKLFEIARTRLRPQIAAAAMVCPQVAPAVDLFEDPEFERRMYSSLLERYDAGMRLIPHGPALRLFAERDVGVLVLFSLLLEAPASDRLSEDTPLPLSIAALARQFRVSRTHILRLIRDGETAGLLFRAGERGEQVRFSPRLLEDLSRFVAATFQYLALCAWQAMPTDETNGRAIEAPATEAR